MIIVEEKLRDLFATLPKITDSEGNEFAVQYDFGTHEDLLLFLNNKSKEETNSYPLIWLETPITKKGKENRIDIDLKLILAINTESEYSNLDRLNISFKPSLIPLYKNVQKALKQSGFTRIIDPEKNKRTDFYNYGIKERNSKDKKHKATDIWDAIKFECELQMTDSQCKKHINY